MSDENSVDIDDKLFFDSLNNWLELFDKKYTIDRVELIKRPFMAVHDFFEHTCTGVTNSSIEKQLKPPYFGYWYNMMYKWFENKYGKALKHSYKKDHIKSFVFINNLPYEIYIPKLYSKKISKKESTLIFPKVVLEDEDVLSWIPHPPCIKDDKKLDIIKSIKVKANILRNINMNLMTTKTDNDECNDMLKSIFSLLEIFVNDIISNRDEIYSDSIWQVSLAVEKILKVKIYKKVGTFKKIHDLEKLLADFYNSYGIETIEEINHLPKGNSSIDYRYSNKNIKGIEKAERIYLESLKIINLVLATECFLRSDKIKIHVNNIYYTGE